MGSRGSSAARASVTPDCEESWGGEAKHGAMKRTVKSGESCETLEDKSMAVMQKGEEYPAFPDCLRCLSFPLLWLGAV